MTALMAAIGACLHEPPAAAPGGWVVLDAPANNTWADLATNGSTYVAVASGTATCGVSSGGVAFTPGTLPAAYNWRFVTYGNGIFVAYSYGATITQTVSATSTDGVTWVQHALPGRVDCAALLFGNGYFALVPKQGGFLYISTDGATWTTVNLPSGLNDIPWCDALFTQGYFIFLSNLADGTGHSYFVALVTVDVSTDPSTWLGTTSPGYSIQWRSLGRCADRTIALSNGFSRTARATDSALAGGNSNMWYVSSTGLSSEPGPGLLVFDGTSCLAITASAVRATVDGITWSTPAQPPPRAATRFVNAGGKIYALGSDIASYTPA